MLVPIYIAEISPAHGRGALSAIMQLGMCLGVMLVYALGIFLDWRRLSFIGLCCRQSMLWSGASVT